MSKRKKDRALITTAQDYNGIKQTDRRPLASPCPRKAPDTLLMDRRDRMAATTWDMQANIALVRNAIAQRNATLSQFRINVQTGDPALDAVTVQVWDYWRQAENCDVRRLNHFDDIFAAHETSAILSGDALIVLTDDAHIQLIDGSAIVRTTPQLPAAMQAALRTGALINRDGVLCSPTGQHLYYIVARNGVDYVDGADIIPADACLYYGYMDDASTQTRGVSPLLSAANMLNDMEQINDMLMAKIRLHSILGMVVKHNPEVSPFTAGFTADPVNSADLDARRAEQYAQFRVPKNGGIFVQEMLPGDDMEVIESKQPSGEYQTWLDKIILMSLKALDIPYSFYNASGYGYPGIKIEANLADRCLKRYVNARRRLLKSLFERVLRLLAANGVTDMTEQHIHTICAGADFIGLPGIWLDEKQEAEAAHNRITYGFSSYHDECLRLTGKTFEQVAVQLARDEAIIRQYGIASILSAAPGQKTVSEAVDTPTIVEGVEATRETKR